MALFIQVMRDERTFDLMDRFPRAFMLLCRIARRMGADGSPALIGPRDFAFDGVDEKGLEKRYRTAKEYLEKNGFARFESSKSGTKAWALSGVVFNLKGGRKGGVKGGQKADTKAEQIELEIDEKGGAKGGQEADAKAEQKADNRDLIQENTNTPPYIPPEGEDQLKIENGKLKVGETAAGEQPGEVGQVGTGRTESRRFVKPAVAEIAAYCLERQNGISAQAFFDSYEAKGWLIGKTPMKDWKAAVRTWERNNFQSFGGARAKPAAAPGKGGGLMAIKTR